MNKKLMATILGVIAVVLVGYFVFQNMPAKEAPITSISITHELGETKLNTRPEKIVTFDWASLETMHALGVEVTGVVKSSLPSYLSEYEGERYTDIGTIFEPNFEEIAKMKPDVIFIGARQRKHYEALSKIAPTLFFDTDIADYIGSFEKNITTIGELFSKEDDVKTYLIDLKKDIKTVQEQAEKMSENALILSVTGDDLNVYGPKSRLGMLHNTLKIKAVDEGIEVATHGQSVGFEYILEKNPDYIFVINRGALTDASQTTSVLDNDVMKKTKAYMNKKIIYLNQDNWVIGSGGMISTTEMVKEIAAAIQ
ncbi:iron ABC transporter substrate-binding protein [Erysipelotrichaceae bacterium]|nr:iron ABC transporter substrate-binding protein [Erysipelotrichaceae bacterium]